MAIPEVFSKTRASVEPQSMAARPSITESHGSLEPHSVEEPRVAAQRPHTDAIAVAVACARKLSEYGVSAVKEGAGTVRVEDAICVLATIVGERCIDAAGELSLRDHEFTPGQRVFSDEINRLLVGDVPPEDINRLEADSVFRFLFTAAGESYPRASYPNVTELLHRFEERIGNPADWGKVPLSVPAENVPRRMPLWIGFDTRRDVDEILAPVGSDKHQALRVSTFALALLLRQVAAVIDPKTALLLSAEIINGMAKTVPMTEKVVAKAMADRASRTCSKASSTAIEPAGGPP